MSRIPTLLAATAIATLAAAPALADKPPHPIHPAHPAHPTKQYQPAPGPEAGLGLPILAAVGGYVLYLRRKRRQAAKA